MQSARPLFSIRVRVLIGFVQNYLLFANTFAFSIRINGMRMREIGPHSIAKLASFRLLGFDETVGKRKL